MKLFIKDYLFQFINYVKLKKNWLNIRFINYLMHEWIEGKVFSSFNGVDLIYSLGRRWK